MQLVVLSDELLKEELLSNGTQANLNVTWVNSAEQFSQHKDSDGFIDLLFDGTEDRIELLKELKQPVIIHSVEKTLADFHTNFTRINAWPTFLKREIVEASCTHENQKQKVEIIFAAFHKKIEWLPDEPGFVSARVVAMIINEAWLAYNEGVSSKIEIDTAMKLGTNYPYGPFEWCSKIGEERILALLNAMAKNNSRYLPAKFSGKTAMQ
jgi:3-hydroxybutyryl-CoA dehydrogenase